MINIGSGNIQAIKVGTDDYIKAYQGSTLVWSAENPVTALTCYYHVTQTGTTTIGNAITSGTSTMIVDGVSVPASTTFNFTTTGNHVVEWVDVISSLPMNAFAGVTALTEVEFPETVHQINYYAFSGCTNLVSADMTVCTSLAINAGAFWDCALLREIQLGPVSRIHDDLFNGCVGVSSEVLIIPETVSSIGNRSFQNLGCNGHIGINLTFPSGITSVGHMAFENSRVTYFGLNDGLLTIGNYAFARTGPPDMDIPASVTSIGTGAFEDVSCQSVRFLGTTPPTFGDDVFQYAPLFDGIRVPEASIEAYKAALPQYVDKIVGY